LPPFDVIGFLPGHGFTENCTAPRKYDAAVRND
jgi:hypothetical protein